MVIDTPDPHEQAALEMERKKKISEYLEETLRGEQRIETRMDPQCEVSVVIPAYAERKGIFRPLLSLAKQEGVKPEQFEVIIVVNNAPNEPIRDVEETDLEWSRKLEMYQYALIENQETLHILNAFQTGDTPAGLSEEETQLFDQIRTSGIKIFAIDKASDGRTLPQTDANVGGARNRGVAEAVERFFEQKGENGIIAQSDADVRFSSNYIASLIGVFKKDPELVGIAGKMEFDMSDEMRELLSKSTAVAELMTRYRWVTERLKSGKHGRDTNRVAFSGGNMASRAYEAGLVRGVPKLPGGEDPAFGFRLADIGKTVMSDEVLTHPLDRFSARTHVTAGHGQKRLQLRDMLESGSVLVESPQAVLVMRDMTRQLYHHLRERTDSLETIRAVLVRDGKQLVNENDLQVLVSAIRSGEDASRNDPKMRDIRMRIDRVLSELYPPVPIDEAVERILVEATLDDSVREKYEEKLREMREIEVRAIEGRAHFVLILSELLRKEADTQDVVAEKESFIEFLKAHQEQLGPMTLPLLEKSETEAFNQFQSVFMMYPKPHEAIQLLIERFPQSLTFPEDDPVRWTSLKLSALSRALE